MTINEIKGNIFDADVQVIVNTVNCVGIMGKGIALEYKYRFPKMFDWYVNLCNNHQVIPGKLFLWKESRPWILNFPTKDDWKYPSKIEYIKEGLEYFIKNYKELGITSIAFPRLGTTSGGLSWEEVKKIMYKYLSNIDIKVLIYEFDESEKDLLFEKLNSLIKDKSIENIKKSIRLNDKTSKLLKTQLEKGLINSMHKLRSIKGFGKESIKKIYSFLLNKDIKKSQNLFDF